LNAFEIIDQLVRLSAVGVAPFSENAGAADPPGQKLCVNLLSRACLVVMGEGESSMAVAPLGAARLVKEESAEYGRKPLRQTAGYSRPFQPVLQTSSRN
jgi:hypothetical protein